MLLTMSTWIMMMTLINSMDGEVATTFSFFFNLQHIIGKMLFNFVSKKMTQTFDEKKKQQRIRSQKKNCYLDDKRI